MAAVTDVVEVYPAKDGWRWRYKDPEGRILGHGGQGYSRQIDCEESMNRVCGHGREGVYVVQVITT